MRPRYALRELWHHRLRTLLAVVGVTVSTAMLVDMLMLGSGLETSFERLLSSRGYALRVAPRGTLPFDTEALIVGYRSLEDSLLAVDGVEGVAPLLGASVELRPGGGGDIAGGSPGGDEARPPLRAFAVGIAPREQGVVRVVAGELPDEGSALLGAETAAELGAGVGDSITLAVPGALGVAGRSVRLRVTGLGEFLYASRDQRTLAVELGTLQVLTTREDRISFAMLRAAPGRDPDEIREAVERAVPRVETVTVAGLVERAGARLSYFRQLAWILGTVAVIVTALLVGTIAAVSIGERIGTIAALRAIGVSRASLLRALALESVALSGTAAGLGLGLGVLTARWLENVLADFPGLPEAIRFFVLEPSAVAMAFGTVVGVGAMASLVPAWRAASLDIARTLHMEEM